MAAATPWGIASIFGQFKEVLQSLRGRIVAIDWIGDWLFGEFAPEIWVAAAYGDTEGVRRLIAGGVDIEARHGKFRSTPLLAAVRTGHNASAESLAGREEVVLLLLQHGADVSAADVLGRTALHLTASKGCAAALL